MSFVQCKSSKKYVKPEEWKKKKNRKYFQDTSRKLLRIEYPGIVDNVDKMLNTLGGLTNIELTVGNPNRRLELRFRPDDFFCKPCWGDKELSPGILVKVRMKQVRSSEDSPDDANQTSYSYSVVGVCGTNIKFTRLCDFQYLPMLSAGGNEKPDSKLEYIYEKIVPAGLPTLDMMNDPASREMPLFLPPAIFSKHNNSQNQLQMKRHKYYEGIVPEIAERLKGADKPQTKPSNVFDRNRKDRKIASIFLTFKATAVPMEARQEALSLMQERHLEKQYEEIKELFEKRAMWPKCALLDVLGIRADKLRIILPCVAYYFQTGPWRTQWCKFGYDPRKDPKSRMHQTFDYRVRASEGIKLKVQAKRSYITGVMHYKTGPTTTDRYSLSQSFAEMKMERGRPDQRSWTLKPGILPPARQIFYQYCDVFLPEVQEMLARLPETPRSAVCDPKDGWLPRGFMDHCRDVVSKHVSDLVQKQILDEKQKENEDDGTIDPKASCLEDTTQKQPAVISLLEDEVDPEVVEVNEPTDGDKEKNEAGAVQVGTSEASRDEEEEEAFVDSDEGNNLGSSSSEDEIDIEAVEEINKLIWDGEKAGGSSDGRSKVGLPTELVQMYHQLILSDDDSDTEDTPGPSTANN